MKSYKQKFQEKLDEEISEFRQKVKAQPAQEIYEDCSRIHFYECMYDYLNTEEFKTSEYKAFLQADNTFIENVEVSDFEELIDDLVNDLERDIRVPLAKQEACL